MKLCKYCRSEIDEKAKVCPHCQRKQKSLLGTVGKAIAVFVFVIIFVPSCAGYMSKSSKPKNEQHQDVTINATTTATKEITTDNNSNKSEDSTEKVTEKTEEVSEPVTEDVNLVIYDNDGLKITYKGIEYGSFTTDIKLFIENNSGRNLTVASRDESVNGFMISGVMVCEIADGKKANKEMSFFTSDLKDSNINYEDIKDIEFKINYYNTDNWLDSIETGPLTIHFGD